VSFQRAALPVRIELDGGLVALVQERPELTQRIELTPEQVPAVWAWLREAADEIARLERQEKRVAVPTKGPTANV
jgi:hypothetical protein